MQGGLGGDDEMGGGHVAMVLHVAEQRDGLQRLAQSLSHTYAHKHTRSLWNKHLPSNVYEERAVTKSGQGIKLV